MNASAEPIDDQPVAEHLLDGLPAAHGATAAREADVGQQCADTRKIAAVHELTAAMGISP